jgi:hypothetical protein
VGGKKRPKVKDVKDVAQRTAVGATASKSDDDDITDWLSEGNDGVRQTRRVDVVAKKQPPHETPELKSPTRDTTYIKTPTDETTTVKPVTSAQAKQAAEAESKEADSKEAQPRGVEAAKRLFGGKLVSQPKNAPKNSHEAANEALKKFFNTRKPS